VFFHNTQKLCRTAVSFHQQLFCLYLNTLNSTEVDRIHLDHDKVNHWTLGGERKHHMSDFPLPAP